MIAVIITAMRPPLGAIRSLAQTTYSFLRRQIYVFACVCECVCTCAITFASVCVRARTALCAYLSSDMFAVRRLGKNYPCVPVRLMYAKISEHVAQLLGLDKCVAPPSEKNGALPDMQHEATILRL